MKERMPLHQDLHCCGAAFSARAAGLAQTRNDAGLDFKAVCNGSKLCVLGAETKLCYGFNHATHVLPSQPSARDLIARDLSEHSPL